jgi:hypothetical protein
MWRSVLLQWNFAWDLKFGLYEWNDDGTQRRTLRNGAKVRSAPPSLIAQCAHPILQPSSPVFRHCMSQAAMITALKKTAKFCNPYLHVHVRGSKWLPAIAGKIAIRKTPGVLRCNSAKSHRVECKACYDRRRLTEVHWWV